MGIIRRQSISGTIYSYVGVLLGFVTTGILFPRILSTEEVGLLRILVSYSALLAQFASLGFNTVTIKLFPYFRDKAAKHHGFLGLAFGVSLVGFIIFVAIYILLKPQLLGHAKENSALLINYFNYVIPLVFFTLIFNAIDTYYRVLYNAVKGIIYKEVIQRVLILAVILIYYFGYIDFHETVILYTLAIISPSILLFATLIYNKQLFLKPDLAFIDNSMGWEMTYVALFGILAGFAGILTQYVDVIMVDYMLGLSAAGIYTITFFFGTLILVPMRTMGKISSVVIADCWKSNDLETINDIYKKSSISMSIVGLLLFIGIWGNVDNIFMMIKDGAYISGKMVIFYIGIANLFDVALSVSPHIIVNSKHYRYLSYFVGGFAVLLVVSNLILIPVYGLVGAAIASLISKFIYNLVKFGFLYRKFGFQPFTMKFLPLIIIGCCAYYASTFLPQLSNYIVDILVRSLLITTLFMVPVYFFKISSDINKKIDELLGLFRII